MKRAGLLITASAAASIVLGSLLGIPAALAASAAAPTAPSDLVATAGDTTVALSWVAPADGGSSILGYNVYESTSPGAENYSAPANGSILVTGNTAVVRGLTNAKTYYFTVAAVNGVGTSSASNEAWAIPGDTVPGAPTSTTATPGDASATVTWIPPVYQGGSAITGYKVTAADATQSNRGGQTCTWTTGPLSCVVSGLTNGDSYTFTVTASNSSGTGAPSGPSNTVVPVKATAKKFGTTTTMDLSLVKVVYGQEGQEHISVTVAAANAGPAPIGRVFVMGEACRTGSASRGNLCPSWSLLPRSMEFAGVLKLSSGTGSFVLPSRAFGPGTYRLWAFYMGSSTDLRSVSASKVLVVARNR